MSPLFHKSVSDHESWNKRLVNQAPQTGATFRTDLQDAAESFEELELLRIAFVRPELVIIFLFNSLIKVEVQFVLLDLSRIFQYSA